MVLGIWSALIKWELVPLFQISVAALDVGPLCPK